MAKDTPSADELRKAAAQRAPARRRSPDVAASTYFANRGGETRASYGSGQDHVIPRTRCTEDMARAMADYGNRHELSPSDTLRALVQAGLDAEEGA